MGQLRERARARARAHLERRAPAHGLSARRVRGPGAPVRAVINVRVRHVRHVCRLDVGRGRAARGLVRAQIKFNLGGKLGISLAQICEQLARPAHELAHKRHQQAEQGRARVLERAPQLDGDGEHTFGAQLGGRHGGELGARSARCAHGRGCTSANDSAANLLERAVVRVRAAGRAWRSETQCPTTEQQQRVGNKLCSAGRAELQAAVSGGREDFRAELVEGGEPSVVGCIAEERRADRAAPLAVGRPGELQPRLLRGGERGRSRKRRMRAAAVQVREELDDVLRGHVRCARKQLLDQTVRRDRAHALLAVDERARERAQHERLPSYKIGEEQPRD